MGSEGVRAGLIDIEKPNPYIPTHIMSGKLPIIRRTPPPAPPRRRGGEPKPQAMAGWGSSRIECNL